MCLTVIHVLASTRADHGGTSRSVPALCEALDAQGLNVHLLTAAPSNADEDEQPILPDGDVQVHLIEEQRRFQRTFRSPLAFYRRLNALIQRTQPDIIHDHGVWLPSNAIAAWVTHHTDVPLVLAPRGMVTDWALAHQAWKKRAAWHVYQKHVFDAAACFHATASNEADALRDLGMTQPVAVVPNGVTLPNVILEDRSTRENRVLFLSRIHPKKGLPMLLDAWADVRPEDWTLELVGPSEDGHRAELERQMAQLGLEGEVVFSGPVDDDAKWRKYATADLFVLPSHSENFGIVVAEALAAGVPALTTTGTPWQEVETHDCGWWVKPEREAIAGALRTATRIGHEERAAMGQRGQRIVESEYTWDAVGKKMKETYEWLTGQNRPPNHVEASV